METHMGLPRITINPVELKQTQRVCEKHGPFMAYVEDLNDEYECPICREEKLEIERQVNAKAENKRICKLCNIEPEYFSKTLDDYIPSSESEKMAKDAVEKLLKGEAKKVILLGGNGTGKTMLGSLAAKEFMGKIYSMYEITTMIRQSYSPRADRTELEIVNELASVPFLAIDEMGRTNCTQSELNWLSYILDKRHVRKLPFMIMTNGHLRRFCKNNGCDKCFENYMDKDVMSRLRQDTILVNIQAQDYRNKN